ncbi:MAG: NAD(P)-binding protein, partial [Thermoprotei archaeon]|nr:NAD(P)-binding protein [Thermoprotei archaeon]
AVYTRQGELRGVFHVIGAGLAGLSLARELLDRGFNVKVVETRDRVGGISILDPEVSKLIGKLCSEVNVRLQSTAVKLGGLTVIVSSRGVERVVGGASATGFRVANPTELGIFGDRPAGVYPFHAALDLLVAGLSPGRVIAVYGANRYSILMAEKLAEYGRRVYVIDPGLTPTQPPRGLEVVKGRVRRLKGPMRLSEIKLDRASLEADTLIIAVFKPWNPFPELPPVGHSTLEVYNPKALVEAGRLLAVNLSCGEHAYRRVIVEGGVQAFPETLTPCLRELLVAKVGGGEVKVNGESYRIEGDYAVIKVPGGPGDLRVRGF